MNCYNELCLELNYVYMITERVSNSSFLTYKINMVYSVYYWLETYFIHRIFTNTLKFAADYFLMPFNTHILSIWNHRIWWQCFKLQNICDYCLKPSDQQNFHIYLNLCYVTRLSFSSVFCSSGLFSSFVKFMRQYK